MSKSSQTPVPSASDPRDRPSRPRPQPGWPKFMMAWTVLVLGLHFGERLGANWINLQTGIGVDVLNVIAFLLLIVLWLSWLVWALFFSRRRWWVRLGIAAGLLIGASAIPFFFEFTHTGDILFVDVTPRFGAKPKLVEAAAELKAIDFKITDEDFPQFLGRGRDGIVVTQNSFATDWTANPPKPLWKIPIGEGWSGIVTANGYAITMEQRADLECVSCYRIESGELVWKFEHAARHDDSSNMGYAGPRSTPTLDQGRVYVQGATGIVMCLDGSTGTLIWKNDIVDLLKSPKKQLTSVIGGLEYEQEPFLAWGRSASPLVVNNKLIVTGGGPSASDMVTLVALDTQDGSLVWKGGQGMFGYGSPALQTIDGQQQITITGEKVSMGLDPETGKTLWSEPWPGNSAGDANCSQVTQVDAQHVLLTKGYMQGSKLLELRCDGENCSIQSVLSNPRALRTKMSSPIVKDGFAYSLSDGFLECVDTRNLSIRWKERTRQGCGQMLLLGNQLLVHGELGTMSLVDATPEGYRVHGEFPTVSGLCWNTFCVSGRHLIVRSNKEMACYELPLQ